MSIKLLVGGIAATGFVETILTADDIYKFYQMWDNDGITQDEFYGLVAQRLLIAITSLSGSALLPMAGVTLTGPVGIVAAGILSVMGYVGGQLAGRAMGESVLFSRNAYFDLYAKYTEKSNLQ